MFMCLFLCLCLKGNAVISVEMERDFQAQVLLPPLFCSGFWNVGGDGSLRILSLAIRAVPATCVRHTSGPECTKIARFSAVAAAIFTAPQNIARFFEAPRCAISSAKKIASEPRFLLRRKWVKVVLAAEFPAIPSSAAKIASERRCARFWCTQFWTL